VSCVVCESYAVQLRPAVDVLVVPYSVRLAIYTTNDTLPQHKINITNKSLCVLNCNFNKEQNKLPEDDRMIETCRSVLSILM